MIILIHEKARRHIISHGSKLLTGDHYECADYLRDGDALARRGELGRDQSNAPISLMVLTLLIDVLTRRLRIILHHLLPPQEKCLIFPGSNFGELSSVDVTDSRRELCLRVVIVSVPHQTSVRPFSLVRYMSCL